MNLIRWNPGSDLLNLQSELDGMFGDMSRPVSSPLAALNGAAQAYLPLDIRRVDDRIEVQASVPGYQPDNVTVTVDAGVITIIAEGESDKQDGEDGFVRRERYQGRLFRQVVLGDGVDGDRATATFADGVLTVAVPLTSRPEPKRIPIETRGEGARKIVKGDAKG